VASILDTQIHVWEPDSPERPWDQAFAASRASFIKFGDAITIERALGAMDAVGVGRAYVTSFHLYHDMDYALEAATRHPDRFAVVPHVELSQPEPAQFFAGLLAHPGVVALRISLMGKGDENFRKLRDGAFDPLLDAIAATGLPLMILASGEVGELAYIADRHPGLTIIVDHLGMIQGPNRTPPDDRFAGIGDLVALARFANVAVKATGVPTLSRESYPFADVRPRLRVVLDAFGADRVMWGSDFTRTRPLHTYADAVNYVRHGDWLSEHERRWLLSGTAEKLVGWHR
jgi:L-fuconolactonase